VNTSSLDSVADYNTSTTGAGLRLGVPITEFDTVNFGLAYEQVTLDLNAPRRMSITITPANTSQPCRSGWEFDYQDRV
jgi:outer membrane protein assembly factor BamA